MSDPREEIDRRLAAGDRDGARRLLAELWRAGPGLAAASFLLSRWGEADPAPAPPPQRLAVLRSFTVEPAVLLLRAAALVAGIPLEVRLGEFNAYAQELLDPGSWLYGFAPEVVLLAVQGQDACPAVYERCADLAPSELEETIAQVASHFHDLLLALRRQSQAHVVIHNFERPAFPAGGLLAAQAEDPVERLNARLREVARRHAGVHVLDYDALVARHGRLDWRDPQKWVAARQPIRAACLPHLAEEWLRFLHPLGGRAAKALVCDLDNTLWGGVVGEDGFEGIRLDDEHPGAAYRALQRAVLDVARRGVLLAICSKNNPDDALKVLAEHPGMLLRFEDFAAVHINWRDKVENLREIAGELDIGLDALAFLDDNPAERERVRSLLPEVTIVELPEDPFAYAETVRRCPVLERLSLTAEDRERTRMYAEQRQRRELQQGATTLEDFYRSLAMRAEIAPVSEATLRRAAQLTQKTNQFNLTTRRYSEQQLAALAADPAWEALTVRLTDRFGDNGIVGVILLHRDAGAWEIDTFLLSCRVIGRTVETAMLATVAGLAARHGARLLTGSFLPNPKNAPARSFYADHGFEPIEETVAGSRYRLDLERARPAPPPWIELEVALDEAPA